MSILQKNILNASDIHFPEYHKVYSISQLGNFIDYRREDRKSTSAKFRLDCLMQELGKNGMTHPILLSPTIAYNVSVGHQRVWYAKENGYTHISAYQVHDIFGTEEDKRLADAIVKDQWFRID